jgi:ankyrin repeat protein
MSYEAASTFEGARPGFIYTLGGMGLGYYPDTRAAVTRYTAGGPGVLFNACAYGDVATLSMLAEKNRGQQNYLAQKSAEGLTLTHTAVRNGALESLQWLISHNALSHDRAVGESLYERCPLHLLANNKSVICPVENAPERDICQLLLSNGASVDSRDKLLRTPLSLAAQHGRAALVRLLIAKGADPSAADHEHDTVLHWAAFSGNLEVLTILLARGAVTSVTDVLGQTPLHIAATQNHMLSAEMLVDASFSSSTGSNDAEKMMNPPVLQEEDLSKRTPRDCAQQKYNRHTAIALQPFVCRAQCPFAVPGTKRELTAPFAVLIAHVAVSWCAALPHLLACTAVTTGSMAWLLLPVGLGTQMSLLIAIIACLYSDPGILTPTAMMHQVRLWHIFFRLVYAFVNIPGI